MTYVVNGNSEFEICEVQGVINMVLSRDVGVVRDACVQLPEGNVGVASGAGGVQRFSSRVARNVANDLLLTRRLMRAQGAERNGLVSYSIDEDRLEKAREIARDVARLAPSSIETSKALVRGMGTMSQRDVSFAACNKMVAAHVRMLEPDHHEDGSPAFSDKREYIGNIREIS